MNFSIPIPPSVNHLFGHTKRGITYITKKGNDWFEEAGWSVKSQVGGYETLMTDCSVDIMMFTAIRRDVDNIGKATLDLIAKHLRIVDNDNQIIDFRVRKFKVAHKNEERLEIQIKEEPPTK